LFYITALQDLNIKLLVLKKMADYDEILKFWYGEDLSALFSDSYEPNFKLWFSGNSFKLKIINLSKDN
jgi:hypothetical protein